MLIIPMDRKLDWRNPPLVTLALVLANLLMFFGFQAGENQALDEALAFYRNSGLYQQEYSWFERFREVSAPGQGQADDEAPLAVHFWAMHTDLEFQDALRQGTFLGPQDSGYADWRVKRARLEGLLQEVVFLEYGLRTARPDAASLVAHMFLHADFMHLFGNMLFLLAVGPLVEVVIGAGAYLLLYLLGGLGSAGFYLLFQADSLVPGIGASGAIAGVMGMFSVLYWARPVRFFFFVFVYFDYLRVPAIVVLPMWIGKELLELLLNPDSPINYYAHLGGLCTGAMLGLAARRWLPSYDLEPLQTEDRERVLESRVKEAARLCRSLEYRRALPLLRRLYREHPERRDLLVMLQEAGRLEPESEDYHAASRRILALGEQDPGTDQLVYETFRDYLRRARPKPRMDVAGRCALVARFLRMGKLREAEALVESLLKADAACPELADLLLRLASAVAEEGRLQTAERYRALALDGT